MTDQCPACGAIASCHCGLLRRVAHSPDLVLRVVDAHARRADEHDPHTCPCGACFTWRVNITDANDLDPFRTTPDHDPETPMRPKPTPDASTDTDTSACGLCGIACPPPPKIDPPTPWLNVNRWPTCPTCQAIIDVAPDYPAALVGLLAEVLDTDLSADDPAARAVANRLPAAKVQPSGLVQVSATAERAGFSPPPPERGADRRWAHVTDADRAKLRAALDQARADQQPRRCQDGPCGGCGVQTSHSWHGPVQTAASHGGPAPFWPLCDACFRVYRQAGSTTLDREWREFLTADALHVPAQMGLSIVRPYADVAVQPPGRAPGVPTRFGYLTDADLAAIYRKRPDLAPLGHPERLRAERIARAQAARAAVAATESRSPFTFDRD